MPLVISHKSAFLFWRSFCGDPGKLVRLRYPRAMSRAERLTEDLRAELQALGFSPSQKEPLDLLFCSAGARSRATWAQVHTNSAPLPSNSLIQLSDHVMIASPELCFIQIAETMPREKLVLAGCELCGTYAQVGPGRVLVQRPQLTSIQRIRALLPKTAGEKVSKPAKALPLVLERAASPWEAKVALLLTLPSAWGGYGLPAPELNAEIPLADEARRLYHHRTCRLDLYWPEACFDVEYDGRNYHEGDAHAKDVARLAALRLEGIDVLELSQAQVSDADAFHHLATVVAATLGKRLRVRRQDFIERRARLREAFRM